MKWKELMHDAQVRQQKQKSYSHHLDVLTNYLMELERKGLIKVSTDRVDTKGGSFDFRYVLRPMYSEHVEKIRYVFVLTDDSKIINYVKKKLLPE